MIESMRRRGFSVRHEESYVRAVSDLARYHNRSPDALKPHDLDAYFRHLALERNLAPASCRVHLNGVRYLYRGAWSCVVRCGVGDPEAQAYPGAAHARGGGPDTCGMPQGENGADDGLRVRTQWWRF